MRDGSRRQSQQTVEPSSFDYLSSETVVSSLRGLTNLLIGRERTARERRRRAVQLGERLGVATASGAYSRSNTSERERATHIRERLRSQHCSARSSPRMADRYSCHVSGYRTKTRAAPKEDRRSTTRPKPPLPGDRPILSGPAELSSAK